MNNIWRFIRFRNLLPAIVAIAMTMIGCAVGPKYQRPEAVTIPEAYTGVSGEWKIAVPKAHLPKGNWWEIFGDPELSRLEIEAAEANQDIKAAYARFNQARAVADVARAGFFPRLSALFSAIKHRDSENRPPGARLDPSYDSLTALPFDLSYEFDLWGRVRRIVESGTAQMQAASDDVQSVRLTIQAEVAADYFAIRTLDADKALLISSIEVYRKSLKLVRNRKAGGMVSDLDMAQAETVLKTAEAQLPDNALQRARFEHALALLVGKNASLFRLLERPFDMGPIVVPTGLPSELLERRPDIAAAERRMAAANAGVGVAAAAFFPTIRFDGMAGFQSNSTGTLFDWPSRLWAVGPSLTLPLFEDGRLRADLRWSEAAYEEAVARYRQSVLSAFAEVENNLAAEQLLADQYRQTMVALEAGRKQLQVAVNRYKAGLVTYLEVATAQNTTMGIERSAMHVRGQQLTAAVSLIKSLGGGWKATDNRDGSH